MKGRLNTHDYNVETKGRLPEVHRFEHLTELARKRGELEIEMANNNIRTEYRKRLHDTREMKGKMEHCISTLNVEMGILERCRDEVVDGLRNFEPNIALSANWTNLRKGRPGSPSMYSENVSRAMAQNNDDLKGCIGRLAASLAELEESLKGLRDCQRYVQHEINAKMTTMIIDNACMEELINPNDLLGSEHQLKSPSNIMQSSKLHTHNEWNNTAESVISTALAQIEVSQSRRKKALSVIRTIREAGRYNRSPLVLDAFQARMKYNQTQLASLDLNISMLTGQIDQLDKQKASLVGSLEKIMYQKETARQRLNVRAMLPSRENTRPNVETTLEVEIVNLERTERDLRDKLRECEKNHVKQLTLRTSMEHERKERNNAFTLDKACFEMRLPSLSDAIRSSAAANNNTARQYYAAGDAAEAGSGRSSGRASSRRTANDSARDYAGESGRGSARAYAAPQPPPLQGASSGRSQARYYGGSARSTATGSKGVAAGPAMFPPIPAPPSPRKNPAVNADVAALLRSGTPTSARSARSGRY